MINEDLRKWVAEKWVDIGAPKKGGGFKPCGRQKGEKRKGYPKCVPLAKANSMSTSQRRSAVKRKRAAGNTGPKPTNVATFKKKNIQEACWKGYKTKGMKKKNGRMVPNCVPVMESNKIILEFDPNRGAKGRAIPKYGHYPTNAEKKNIENDFGGNLPLPKRSSKPKNMLRAAQGNSQAEKNIRDALGVYFATKQNGIRYQPNSSPIIPGQFDHAKEAGRPISSRFREIDPSKTPKTNLINRFFNRRKGKGTPAHSMEAQIANAKIKFRKGRNRHKIDPEDFVMSESIINIIGKKLLEAKSPAWQRSEGKDPKGGLNRKGIASYRAANPGSKLSMAVTTKPSKLKKGSKAANRRKSFCARMSGLKSKLTSKKTASNPDSRVNKALRKWNC